MLLAAHNETQSPARVEIPINPADLKIILRQYSNDPMFTRDGANNLMVGICRLVPSK